MSTRLLKIGHDGLAFFGAIALIIGAIVAIIVLPFWIVATVAVVLALLGLGFIVIFGRARE